MALEQDFLPFATGAGANVVSQAVYAALSALSTGYQSGVAQSAQLNKTWRQSSIIASVLAQFIVKNSGQPAVDDGTTATLLSNLVTAVQACARQNPVLLDTGIVNAYAVSNAAAFTAYPTVSGLIIDVSIAHTNTGASTLNVDGIGTKPIYGLGLQALQGGELPTNGVASLMYVVAPNVNSGNGGWVILECTGGAQQIAPATASNQAMQFSQLTGCIGTARNLSANNTSGSTTITFTADQIIVGTALNGLQYALSSYSQTVNLGTTGAGGLDTGTAPLSGYVAVYAIYNPTSGASSILATNATSTAAPTIYAGGHMPTGYTASALISVWPTNSSGLFVTALQQGRNIKTGPVTALNTTTQSSGSYTSFSVATAVPKNAVSCSGSFAASAVTTNTTSGLFIASTSAGVGQTQVSTIAASANASVTAPFDNMTLITPQTLYYETNSASGGTFIVIVTGYEF